MSLPSSITLLSDKFSSLPGIGPKLSSRIALYLAISNKKLAGRLGESLESVIKNIKQCSKCFNVTDNKELCEICLDEKREKTQILVVETPLELYTIEETGDYKGLYHVTHGVISPVNGVGPSDITIPQLLKRLSKGSIEELIFGLNPTLEGDSTSMYVSNEITQAGVKVKITKLAKGIPSGSSIEYMSSQTLSDSLKRRDSLDSI